jgi:hypothetical protein
LNIRILKAMIRKLGLIMFVAGVTAIGAQAQDKPNESRTWHISKGVQRQQLKGEQAPALEIRSGNADWAIAKGVHRSKSQPASGNVTTTGYPTWTISKGVARQQAEKSKR